MSWAGSVGRRVVHCPSGSILVPHEACGFRCPDSEGWNWERTVPRYQFIFIVVWVMALLQYSQGFGLLGQTFALTSKIIILPSVAQPREFIILSD